MFKVIYKVKKKNQIPSFVSVSLLLRIQNPLCCLGMSMSALHSHNPPINMQKVCLKLWSLSITCKCVYCLPLPGGYLVAGHHGHRARQGGTAELRHASNASALPHPQIPSSNTDWWFLQKLQRVHRSLPQQGPFFCKAHSWHTHLMQ